MAAATAPATATKLAAEVYTAELAGMPSVGAPAGAAETAEGVIAEGASVGVSMGGAGGEAIGDGDAAVGGVATGAGAVAGDLAGGAGSGAILGAGMGAAPGACAAAVTARRATMAATTAKRAITLVQLVIGERLCLRSGELVGVVMARLLRICVQAVCEN